MRERGGGGERGDIGREREIEGSKDDGKIGTKRRESLRRLLVPTSSQRSGDANETIAAAAGDLSPI